MRGVDQFLWNLMSVGGGEEIPVRLVVELNSFVVYVHAYL